MCMFVFLTGRQGLGLGVNFGPEACTFLARSLRRFGLKNDCFRFSHSCLPEQLPYACVCVCTILHSLMYVWLTETSKMAPRFQHLSLVSLLASLLGRLGGHIGAKLGVSGLETCKRSEWQQPKDKASSCVILRHLSHWVQIPPDLPHIIIHDTTVFITRHQNIVSSSS